jgi:hypothetical protein
MSDQVIAEENGIIIETDNVYTIIETQSDVVVEQDDVYTIIEQPPLEIITETGLLNADPVTNLYPIPGGFYFNQPPVNAPADVEGEVVWNTDDHTLDINTGFGNVVQVGQEVFGIGVNKTGSQVDDGKVVYLSGVQGNRPTMDYADARDEEKVQVVGIVTANIQNNEEGPVTTFGIVRGYDTSPYPVGTKLYIASDATGDLTDTVPTGTSQVVWMATTLNQTNNGDIFVYPIKNGVVLLGGRPGGQAIYGDTEASGSLTLVSTNNATKGKILFGANSAYDELNTRLGIGTVSPGGTLGLIDSNTYLTRDGSNNLSFTDAVTGTKTLAELSAGGGGSPGGSDTQVQYNNGGSFGGASGLVYDDVNDRVGVIETTPLAALHVSTGATGEVGQIIKGVASQSENLQEWQDSTGTVGTAINESGIIDLPVSTSTVGIIKQNDDIIFHTYGTSNLFFGKGSGSFVTTGAGLNVGVGQSALKDITTGVGNSAFGSAAGAKITTGNNNFAMGAGALAKCTTGSYNTAIGQNALNSNVSSSSNCMVGRYSGRYVTGLSNLGLGTSSLTSVSGSGGINDNVAIGTVSGTNLTTGASNNVFIGIASGFRQTSISNTLIIDSRYRSDAATELTNGIIVGTMASTPSSQILRVNANLGVNVASPASMVTVSGDVETTGSANGLILESPDTTRWRVTIDNTGTLSTATV